jgi:hypothetical protein
MPAIPKLPDPWMVVGCNAGRCAIPHASACRTYEGQTAGEQMHASACHTGEGRV